MEGHRFRIVSDDSPEIMRKLRLLITVKTDLWIGFETDFITNKIDFLD